MRTHFLPLLLLGLWLTAACTHRPPSYKQVYTDVAYDNACAKGFHIWGARDRQSTVIEVTNPWQNARDVTMAYFVARGGEQPPEDFDGVVIPAGPRRIVCMSSSYVGMLDALGATDRVVGVSGLDYINSPALLARRDSVRDVGAELDFEVLLGLKPDLVLLYGVAGEDTAVTNKLRELGIPYIYIGDYVEESPLGKAEWMVALSEVAGKRGDGEKTFAAIPVRYNALKKKVVDSALGAPSVMLNVPYGDSWFMPSTQSYAARLIADAGGHYVYQKNTGNASVPIDMEEAYLLASDADMWLNVGMANSLDELKTSCPKFTDTRCFKNGNVYNNNARTNAGGGNDYYESAVVNPDIVLRDLVKIFHPELVQEEYVYYKQLK